MKMLKRMFQLTDKGTAGIVKASIASFFSYCSLMIPMILLMFFIQNVIEGKENEKNNGKNQYLESIFGTDNLFFNLQCLAGHV